MTKAGSGHSQAVERFEYAAERIAAGKKLRDAAPLASHGRWRARSQRPTPLTFCARPTRPDSRIWFRCATDECCNRLSHSIAAPPR
jgi:hypothetical protein